MSHSPLKSFSPLNNALLFEFYSCEVLHNNAFRNLCMPVSDCRGKGAACLRHRAKASCIHHREIWKAEQYIAQFFLCPAQRLSAFLNVAPGNTMR